MPTFSEELSRLMAEKGISQQQLATAMGVHQTFISKLCRGDNTRFGADLLYPLCKTLGVTCEHFEPYLAAVPVPPVTEPPAAPAEQAKSKRK